MNKERFIQTILPLQRKLVAFALRFTNNEADAEDIVQEVLAKLWTVRQDLDRYNNIKALTYQVTRNLCLNWIKQEQLKKDYLEKAEVCCEPGVSDDTVEQKDELEKVLRIMDRLPDLQQSILRMKYIDGLEVGEIAELTGSRPEAIWMNLSRARKKVRELFNKMDRI